MRATLSSIGDAVITADPNGDVTFLNPVARDLTGWTQEDAAGVPLETVFAVVNANTRRTIDNPAIRALREGVVVGPANHRLLIAKDGTERPIEDTTSPIRIAGGKLAGVVLVFRDLSERRWQEPPLQNTCDYCKNIIATLREPFLVLTRDLRITMANRSFYDTFHVSKQDTEQQFIYDLGNRQWDIPAFRALLEEVLANDHPIHDYEIEQTFPVIGRKIMRLNALRVYGEGTQSELILLAIEDRTERRRAAYELEVSESRYRRLFETAQDAILILDEPTGQIVDANPFIEELLGYSQAELVGKQLWQIGLFRDIEENKAAFRELQAQGYIRYDDLPLKTKTGQRIEVEFVSNTYQVDSCQVIQCNIRDTTERARLGREATEQAKELADLHRRKDEFLAMLSHELRNPLAAIFSAMHILRLQTNENPIQKHARAVLERQVKQLSSLVDDLLEVSRVITGRIQLHEVRLDMRGVVEHAVESVRPLIDRRKQHLSVSLPSEPVWLNADAARLDQVIVNLLNNAAKYTDEGRQIWLTLHPEGTWSVLRVRDKGIGIAPELLPGIFDLFTQAERTLDRSQGGLGIGLSLVQRLVQLHHGTAEAKSAGLNQGSEFIVRLPLCSPPAPHLLPAIETAKPTTQTERILVVDDNTDAADMVAMTLQMAGHEVRAAYSGKAALQTAVDYQPDFVLLDIGMPEMDGYEVAHRLRQLPQTKNLGLIAITGYGQDSDRQRTQEAGFDYHLVKPVEREKLEEVLTMLAEQRRSVK